MKWSLLFVIGFLCMSSGVSEETTLSWREHLKLTWKDFRGKPQRNTGVAAVTASGITFGYSLQRTNSKIVGFKYTVDSHFYPNKSWYDPALANDHILQHERLHFDITELYVRQLRKHLETLELSEHIQRDIKRLHDDANQQLAQMQNRYDKETDHSRNDSIQAKWQVFVANELNKWKTYKSKD